MKYIIILLALLYSRMGYSIDTLVIPYTYSAGPDVVEAEYFFDTDPGFGLGTAVTMTSGTGCYA